MFFGNRSMDTGRRPASPSRPKKVFEGSKGRFFKNAPWQGVGQRPAKRGRASKRGTPFQAGQGPFTKRPQTVRLCLYAPKKFLGVPRGGFSKTLLGREWDSVPQREGEPVSEVRLFRRDKGLSRNAHRPSGFAFMPPKSFWGFQGAVFQKRSLAGCGTASHKRREQASASEHAFSGGTKSLHETSTDCPASPSRT